MIEALVKQYRQAQDELYAIEFKPALQAYLQDLRANGIPLPGSGVNFELDDYVDVLFTYHSFYVSDHQTDRNALTIDYRHRDDEDAGYSLSLPYRYFAVEPSEAAVSQQASTSSPIHAKLEEYVSKRGIPMPFYTHGSKILEEGGELVEALQSGDPTKVMEEVADVTITAAVAAHQFGFSVEAALDAKIAKDTGRGPKV